VTEIVEPDGTIDPAGGLVVITSPIGTDEDASICSV
jgi:hypothetical protein